MSADLDKLAIEAEADRLSGVYLRVTMLARARRIDVLDAGREAVAKGLISAADWVLVREALGVRHGDPILAFSVLRASNATDDHAPLSIYTRPVIGWAKCACGRRSCNTAHLTS